MGQTLGEIFHDWQFWQIAQSIGSFSNDPSFKLEDQLPKVDCISKNSEAPRQVEGKWR
jgi:hypothetical protein